MSSGLVLKAEMAPIMLFYKNFGYYKLTYKQI